MSSFKARQFSCISRIFNNLLLALFLAKQRIISGLENLHPPLCNSSFFGKYFFKSFLQSIKRERNVFLPLIVRYTFHQTKKSIYHLGFFSHDFQLRDKNALIDQVAMHIFFTVYHFCSSNDFLCQLFFAMIIGNEGKRSWHFLCCDRQQKRVIRGSVLSCLLLPIHMIRSSNPDRMRCHLGPSSFAKLSRFSLKLKCLNHEASMLLDFRPEKKIVFKGQTY